MKLGLFRVAALGLVVAAGSWTLAADKAASPAEKPAGTKDMKSDSAKAAKAPKVNKPWSDISSLTDEQKSKIEAIHKKSLAEINDIEKKEKEDCMAVLTDEQKSQLKDASDKKKKDSASKKASDKAGEKAGESGEKGSAKEGAK